MTNEYDVGDLVRIQGTFTDAAGAAFDPDVVTAKYLDPSGNATTDASPTKSATGVYYTDVTIDELGTWYYRFEGTAAGGAKQGAEESNFQVAKSQFS
jgi:hypothetical protein